MKSVSCLMLHRTAKSRPVALKYRPSCIGLPPQQAKACFPRSAVRRLRSPFVYSFPHSLTAHNPDRLESLLPRGLPSAVRGLHSFIRSPIR